MLCYEDKLEPLDRAMANFKRSIGLGRHDYHYDYHDYLRVASLTLTPL